MRCDPHAWEVWKRGRESVAVTTDRNERVDLVVARCSRCGDWAVGLDSLSQYGPVEFVRLADVLGVGMFVRKPPPAQNGG